MDADKQCVGGISDLGALVPHETWLVMSTKVTRMSNGSSGVSTRTESRHHWAIDEDRRQGGKGHRGLRRLVVVGDELLANVYPTNSERDVMGNDAVEFPSCPYEAMVYMSMDAMQMARLLSLGPSLALKSLSRAKPRPPKAQEEGLASFSEALSPALKPGLLGGKLNHWHQCGSSFAKSQKV
ncbi:hypothetical protein JB92DRAFT_2825588 [Gautieria morchelliformis]|nr:hypothetical protein JB92DRAFT_2825588 [Gautieria morchelliformis]